MAWLTPKRAKLYIGALGLALVLTFLIKIRFLYRQGGYDLDGNLLGADFSSFWAASYQLLLGHVADVYVQELHYLAEWPLLRGNYEFFFILRPT